MLKEFFEQNNFRMVSEYKKDGIYFIYTYEKGQHFLEFKKNDGVSNSVISLITILGIKNEVLDEKKFLELLKNNYDLIKEKLANLTDAEIKEINNQSVMAFLGIKI